MSPNVNAEVAEQTRTMLIEAGFDDVRVIPVPIPEHLNEWIATDASESLTIEKIKAMFTYYRIETKQGAFGIMYAPEYPLLDMKGWNISPCDLEPHRFKEASSGFMIPIIGGIEQLLRLWQHMTKRRTQP